LRHSTIAHLFSATYDEENELAALIAAMHGCAQQQVRSADAGCTAGDHEKPVVDEGAAIDDEAVARISMPPRGYSYFLQEWGKHSWDAAPASPITTQDVTAAAAETIAALDENFFRVRFARLTLAKRRYLRAMAELGPGPHRSGGIADALQREVTSLGPTRSGLIAKGMIWSPSHGDTAFTVPLFDEFMKRIMPGSDWR
jgi:hypothetical protein